ncbi:MAG: glycosyl transferase [Clostridia bacterium]|nr:glycosyl transferase [Clostridia bacterium]
MVIHYCWLGRGEKPEKVKYCIESWKKICPNAQIKEWNEDNYDVNAIAYTKQAYEQKKYAFVSDYMRFDVLHREGGVYLDTDVELLKDITPLTDKPFMALERAGEVNPGLIMNALGGEKLLRQVMDYYEKQESFNLDKTVVTITTEILREHGLGEGDEKQSVAGFEIYPTEYFNPKGGDYGKEVITENTYSVHHYLATWKPPIDRLLMEYKVKYGVKKGKLLFVLRHPILAFRKLREKK